MDLGAVPHSYGGPLLFLWACLQGEAGVIVAGALAEQGYWPWWAVWLLASVPAVLGHQIYFALGRRFGPALAGRLPVTWRPRVARAMALVRGHARRVMVSMRIAYGIRLPLPIACGASGIAPARFFRYNVGTGLVWALLFTLLGYGWGTAATAAFHRVAHYEQ